MTLLAVLTKTKVLYNKLLCILTRDALLDLFCQLAAKPCFHALRTQQRLGYSVSLAASRTQRVAALTVRIQSPDTPPAVLQARTREWLAGFGSYLQVGTAADYLLNTYTLS